MEIKKEQELEPDDTDLNQNRISISRLIDSDQENINNNNNNMSTPPKNETTSDEDQPSNEHHDSEPPHKRRVRHKKRYGQLTDIVIGKSKPTKLNPISTVVPPNNANIVNPSITMNNNNHDQSVLFSKFRMLKPLSPPPPQQLQPLQSLFPYPQPPHQYEQTPTLQQQQLPHMVYSPVPPPQQYQQQQQQQPLQLHLLPQMLVHSPMAMATQHMPTPPLIPNSPMITVVPCIHCQQFNQLCDRKFPICHNCEISNRNCQYQPYMSHPPTNIQPVPHPPGPVSIPSTPMTIMTGSSSSNGTVVSYFDGRSQVNVSNTNPYMTNENNSYRPPQIANEVDQASSVVIDSLNFEFNPSSLEVVNVKKSTLLTCGDMYFKLFSFDFPIISKREFLTYLHQFLYNRNQLDNYFKFQLFMIISIGSKAIENLNGSTMFSISQQFFKQAILLNRELANDQLHHHTSGGKNIDNLKRLLLLGIYSLLESSELISWEISGKLSRLISLVEPDQFKQDYQLKLLCSNIYIIEGLITATLNKNMTINESYLIDDNIEHSKQLRIRQLEMLIMQSKKKRSNSIISYADKKSIESQLSYWYKGGFDDDSKDEFLPIRNKRDYNYLLANLYYYSSNTSTTSSSSSNNNGNNNNSITNQHSSSINDTNRRKIMQYCQDYFQQTLELANGGNLIIGWMSLYRLFNICTIYFENLIDGCETSEFITSDHTINNNDNYNTINLQNFINCYKILQEFNNNNSWVIVNQVSTIFNNLINLYQGKLVVVDIRNNKTILVESYNSFINMLRQHSSLDLKSHFS
ncbi:hypothetical protein DFJ63DRAFT_316748 [Scheffersomyces coipomensis]|uniref:uncharacterized protein n=1 Tax=Scheffersomyces coipomensis TaxID=1788519 RepID=UPI00315DA9D3